MLRYGVKKRRLIVRGTGVEEALAGQEPGVRVELVRIGTVRAQDMQNLDASDDQGVGDEAAMAAPGDRFGAEDDGGMRRGAAHQALEGGGELRGLHVVGVAAEGLDPPGGMLGVGARGAPAAEVGLVEVVDAGPGEGRRQGFARELRMAPRGGIAPDVDEPADAVVTD